VSKAKPRKGWGRELRALPQAATQEALPPPLAGTVTNLSTTKQ
jgi:hypothetical protein